MKYAWQKVIDPEKFVLEQVYRPYQSMLGFDKTLTKIPYSNEMTIYLLSIDSEWSGCVLERIRNCKFRFSKWINHPIINYLKKNASI